MQPQTTLSNRYAIRRLNATFIRFLQGILGVWLFHANRHLGYQKEKEAFYQLKTKLLNRFGIRDGYDMQLLPPVRCRRCRGTGRVYEEDEQEVIDCEDCDGTGNYHDTAYVVLNRFRLGRFVFHQPFARYRRHTLPELFVYLLDDPNRQIQGKTRKVPTRWSAEAKCWLFLLFEPRQIGFALSTIRAYEPLTFGVIATPLYLMRWCRLQVVRSYNRLLRQWRLRNGSFAPPSYRLFRSAPPVVLLDEPDEDLPF